MQINRVHRLGQARPVTVWRLVTDGGSIEQRVREVQKRKNRMVADAFRFGPPAEASLQSRFRLRIGEVAVLLGAASAGADVGVGVGAGVGVGGPAAA